MAEVVRYECDSCGRIKPIAQTFIVGLVEITNGSLKHLCRPCAIGLANYMRLLEIPFHLFESKNDRLGRLALWVRPMELRALSTLWPEQERKDLR